MFIIVTQALHALLNRKIHYEGNGEDLLTKIFRQLIERFFVSITSVVAHSILQKSIRQRFMKYVVLSPTL